MFYTKRFSDVLKYLKKHPGYVIQRQDVRGEVQPPLTVLSPNLDDDVRGAFFCTYVRPKTNERVECTFYIKTLFDKGLILPDGQLFVLANPSKAHTASDSKSIAESHIIYETSFDPERFQRNVERAKELLPSPSIANESLGKPVIHYGSHKELERAMDGGRTSSWDDTPSHFWHLTEFENAVAIINSGFFKSRYQLNGKIPYDNLLRCSTSLSVMASNRSKLIERYCRFYLRPRFKFTFALIRGSDSDTFVQFSVSRNRIFEDLRKGKIPEPALMIPFSGHYATDEDLLWRNQINTTKKVSERDFGGFCWRDIYVYYEKDLPNRIKDAQFAEFLVDSQLSCDYIDAIYFQCESDRRSFLENINPSLRPKVEELCIVKPDYF